MLLCRRICLRAWPVLQASNRGIVTTGNEPIASEEILLKSKYPDVGTVVGITLPEYVRSYNKFANSKQSIAFEDGITGAKISHGEVFRNARNFAAALQEAGFQRRDTVGIVLPNNIHFASILYGVMEAGLIPSTVNPAYTPEEMLRQVADAQCKCVVTIPPFIPFLRNFQKTNPSLTHLIVLGEAMEGCHTYTEMIKVDGSKAKVLRGADIDTTGEVAILPYSSGTTGKPKGVALTHSNLVTQMVQLTLGNCGITVSAFSGRDERFIGLLPFFHSYGLTTFVFIGPMVAGTTLCLPKFDPVTFLNAVRTHKPTILHVVTPLIALINSSPEYGSKELESVHTVVGGAAPIGPWLIEKLLEKAGKYFFFQEVYGMTELSPGCMILPQSTKNTRVGSCGTLIPSTFGKLVATDGTGKTLGPNERGEICIKGPQVMKGYWNNDVATKETVDSDGWLHTGDIAYYDKDEYFYIVDRVKELIKVRGNQVAPAELEDLLRQHPNIVEAAVIGIPHPEAGELPRAYIVSNDPKLTADDVHKFLQGRISRHKELTGGVEFVSAIPKAPSGKLLRRVLKVEYCQKNGIPLP